MPIIVRYPIVLPYNNDFDIIIPDNENVEAKIVSKGILNGEKVGDDVSKTGFNTAAGKQAEGIDVMVYFF